MQEHELRSMPATVRGSFLYVAEFDNGLVKVGATYEPKRRLIELEHRARKAGTGYMKQAHVELIAHGRDSRALFAAERKVLRLIDTWAIRGHREWFKDVHFQRAKDFVSCVADEWRAKA